MLEQEVQMGNTARRRLIESALFLVFEQAEKYFSDDLDFLDRIQEGNMGLTIAGGKFDPKRGTRFTTFAWFWVRQAIERAVGNSGSGGIKIPDYLQSKSRRIKAEVASLLQSTGDEPSLGEICKNTGMSPEEIRKILATKITVISLESRDEGIWEEEASEVFFSRRDQKGRLRRLSKEGLLAKPQEEKFARFLTSVWVKGRQEFFL